MPVPTKKGERPCACGLGVSIVHLSSVIVNYETVRQRGKYYFFHYIILYCVITWNYHLIFYILVWGLSMYQCQHRARVAQYSYKPITNTGWVRARLCILQKGCTRLATASDKVYQLLAHGRWFSPGTPASSIIKTGPHDIAEILLKVCVKTPKIKNQLKNQSKSTWGSSGLEICLQVIFISSY